MELWFEGEMSPQTQALDTWSPEGGAVSKVLKPLEDGVLLEEIGCTEFVLGVHTAPLSALM